MDKTLYKIIFTVREEEYEIYAEKVYDADIMFFTAIENIQFGDSALVVDPSEERMKHEFRDVKRFFIPTSSIIRIDEVKKTGPVKITNINDKVTQLHHPLYPEKFTHKAK